MVELRADAADIRDVTGPGNGHALPGAAKCDATCLVHLKGVSKAHDRGRPCADKSCRAPVFVMQQLYGFRQSQDAVVGGHLVKRSSSVPSALVPLSPLV